VGFRQAAVDRASGDQVDFGRLNKSYANEASRRKPRRYGTSHMNGAEKLTVWGKHGPHQHVTRRTGQMSMLMGMRRFTRLTTAFSKKLENHMHAVSFYPSFTTW
jgi:hypothetical protein